MEALRFSPNSDVVLGGFGLYGGRGSYNAEIKVGGREGGRERMFASQRPSSSSFSSQVFDIGENGGEVESEGTLLASHMELGYTCERQQTCHIFFPKPVLLKADNWYVAYAAVSSPSGSSSDAGSSGQAEIVGPDK